MSEQQQTLKWGDIVRVHGVNLSKKNTSKGLVLSKGFTDPNIYYQKYTDFANINFYRQSLFQLLPKSNFDVHDQLLDQNISPQQRQILKTRAVSEVQGLYTNLRRIAGTQIKYGAQVVFKHVESNSYLRGVLKAADTGDGAFRIQVTQNLSTYTLFRLRSHRSYQHEGDKIYYDDQLLIYHEGSDCFMNFADNDKPIYLDDAYDIVRPQEQSLDMQYIKKRPSIKKPVQNRISVINENKSKCLWKFIQHCNFQQSEKKSKIKSHDIVYFEHTKNKGMISSSLATQQFYLKQSNEQKQYFQCFWELIPKLVNEFGPENCQNFWARNIITGQFLQYNGFKVQIQSKEPIQGGGFVSNGLVNLICTQGGHKLQRGQIIPLDTSLPKIVQFSEQRTTKLKLIDVKELKEDSFCIIRVDQQTMMNIQYVVSSHEPIMKFVNVISSQNLKRKNLNLDYKTMFLSLNEDALVTIIGIIKLLAGKIYATTYQNIGPSGNTPNPTIQKILVQTGITELLIEIIFILYDPFKEIERNNQPSQDRAIRNKISQIFECTYKLLQKIAVNCQQNRYYLSRWVDLFLEHSNNINRSYIQECLVCILQNNPVSIEATINQQKINQLIRSFFAEAEKQNFLTTKYLRLFSTFIKCQDRVIKQNQQIILNNFFKQKKNLWSFKFKLQEKQQEEVPNPNKLPSNHPVYDKILKHRVEIALGKQDFSSIPKFFKDWGPKWNYFLAYVNLLADISMDRNSESIENVSALISLQIVAVILNDPDIGKLNEEIRNDNATELQKSGVVLYPISNVHQPFVRIAHYVYINNQKFVPIKRIKNISRWYRLQEEKGGVRQQKINKTKRPFEGQKQQEEKTYLMNILSYIQTFVQNCDQDSGNLNILYTVLNLLKETILLGLWESIQQFRKIVPLLVMRIDKVQNNKYFYAEEQVRQRNTATEWVNKNKQKLKLNRPEINLGIECKIKSSEIYSYINQMEIDIRLRYMMNFFKGLYEATQSFQDYNRIQEEKKYFEDEQIKKRNESAKEEFLKNESASILGDVKRISEDQDIMLKEIIWYNKVKELTPFQYNPSFIDIPSKDRYLFQGQKRKQEKPDFESMVLAIFELPVYQNHKLLNSSLIMLREMFEQRKDLIQKFKSILICGKGNLLEVYLTLKYMRMKFNMLTNLNIIKYKDMNDESYPFAFFKSYDSSIKQNEKRSGILQDLFFLARTLKQDINLKNIQSLMLVEDNIFDENIVYSHMSEKEKNNNLFQRVNIAEGIYIPLLQYIRIIGKNQISENHRRVLFGIYNYLSLLCFNNLEAKQILMHYIPDVLPHLSKKVGAANFIYQVSINNKLLVNNQDLVVQIIDGALQACIQLDSAQFFGAMISKQIDRELVLHRDYEKGKIFNSLRGILLYNDEGHKHNQELLINRLQDNKYKRLIFKGKTEFINKKQNFSLTPEESYIANHFQLFSALVESKNFINIGKLQNIHPYTYCLDCLKSTNRWQLRRALRAYVNRLYYVNKDRDIFLFEQFIRKQFKIINDELNDLIQLHRSKLLTDQTPIPNGIRFKYAQSQIMQMILQILITLHQMLLKPDFLKILKRQIGKQQKKPQNQRQIHDQFVKLATHLGCLLLLYPKTKTISSFINQIKKHITKIMMDFQIRYLSSKVSNMDEGIAQDNDDLGVQPEKKNYIYDHSKSFFRNLNSMIRDIKAKEAKQKLRQKLARRKQQQGTMPDSQSPQAKLDFIQTIFSVQGQTLKQVKPKRQRGQIFASQYKPHIQTANSRIFKVIAKPLLGQNDQNIQLNRRLGEVKVIIEDSPAFRKLRDDEFYKLVTTLTNIDQISRKFYQKQWLAVQEKKSIPVVSLKQILTKSFNLIMRYPQQVKDSQKIFVIKLARCYITESVQGNQSYKLPVDKWSADYYSGQTQQGSQSEFVRRQNVIQSCGGSDFIISILSQNLTSRTQLLNQTLLLGIAYLFNGNTICQDSLLSSLRKDSDNKMLISIRNLIKVIGNFLIEIRKIKQLGKERSFAYKIQDTYDYFDPKQNTIVKQFGYKTLDKFQQMAQLNFEKALCRMFRFLQLFCQNNNVPMKNFLLQQTNQDESRKTNSVNFIEESTLLLRKLFKIMNDKVVSIPPFLLDFINQITQLPCLNNQKAFMKSTFFEDISYLADFFQSVDSILQRKFNPIPQQEDDPYNCLKGIYQKGIQLALCNFQGNDNVLIWEFLSKCQPKFMWICIKQSLLILLKQKAQEWGIDQKAKIIQNDEEKEQQDEGQIKFSLRLLAAFDVSKIEELIKSQKAASKQFREQILKILNVLYILRKIQDYGAARKEAAQRDKQNINKQQLQKALKTEEFRVGLIQQAKKQYKHIQKFLICFKELILSIQVSSHNGQSEGNQFLYFPNHPVFQYLALNTRDDIMMRVVRQTQRDKQISLIGMKQQVYEQVQLNYDLNYNQINFSLPFVGKKQFSFPITSDFCNKVRGKARNVSFFICFLLVLFILVDHDTEQQSSTFTYSNFLTEILIQIFCKIQLALTLGFLYIWIRLRKPLALKKYEAEGAGEPNDPNPTTLIQLQDSKKSQSKEQGWDTLYKIIMSIISIVGSKIYQAKKYIAENPYYKNTITAFVALYNYQSGFLSILIFVLATLAGNFIGVEWYTIHIFDIFTDISELTNIFKAILQNIQKLAILSMLAGAFILVFNVLSLSTYTHVIWEQDFPEQSCEQILSCVLQLYTSGAIGDDMDQFEFGRFIFDIAYVVFMEMMFQNIVGGIMIDAFAGLKQEDSSRQDDKTNNCYICSMTKANMQKNGETFGRHVKKHFLWNYLYYIYCLQKKDPTDFTGLQYSIDSKIKSQDVTWFPVAKSEGESGGEVEEIMNGLQETVKTMKSYSDSIIDKSLSSLDGANKLAKKVVDSNKKMIE